MLILLQVPCLDMVLPSGCFVLIYANIQEHEKVGYILAI